MSSEFSPNPANSKSVICHKRIALFILYEKLQICSEGLLIVISVWNLQVI